MIIFGGNIGIPSETLTNDVWVLTNANGILTAKGLQEAAISDLTSVKDVIFGGAPGVGNGADAVLNLNDAIAAAGNPADIADAQAQVAAGIVAGTPGIRDAAVGSFEDAWINAQRAVGALP